MLLPNRHTLDLTRSQQRNATRMAMERSLGLVALVGSLSFLSVTSAAVEKDLTNKGEALVKENCSRCHAISKEGESPPP